jgi:protein-L-isoaspartate(D-aspartate) O-methyltransferase
MAMVESQLAARGVADIRVLNAMAWVPREDFLPEDRRSWAYRDRAVPLGLGQTVSQPYVIAAMTEALQLGPKDRVLEVGTGSGYQTAVLSAIASEVFTIERLADLQ